MHTDETTYSSRYTDKLAKDMAATLKGYVRLSAMLELLICCTAHLSAFFLFFESCVCVVIFSPGCVTVFA